MIPQAVRASHVAYGDPVDVDAATAREAAEQAERVRDAARRDERGASGA